MLNEDGKEKVEDAAVSTFEQVEGASDGEGKILDDAEAKKIEDRVTAAVKTKGRPKKVVKEAVPVEDIELDEEGKPIAGEEKEQAAIKKKEDAKVINIDGSASNIDGEEVEEDDFLKVFPEYKEIAASTEKEGEKPNKEVVHENPVEETEEVKTYKIKASKWDEVENDPYVNAIISFKESGKDISELPEFLGLKSIPKLSSFKNPTDGDLSIIEELITSDIAKLDLPNGDVKEAIEEQMDKFNEMDTSERKAWYDGKVANQKTETAEKLKNFKVEKKADPYIVHNNTKIDTREYAEPEKTVQIVEKAENDLKAILEQNIGKEIGGFVVFSQVVRDKVLPALVAKINSEGAVRDKNKKIIGYTITDAMLRKVVIAEDDELHTQLVRKDAIRRAKKQWLIENNMPEGGNTRGSLGSGLRNKTVNEIIKTDGNLKYIDG